MAYSGEIIGAAINIATGPFLGNIKIYAANYTSGTPGSSSLIVEVTGGGANRTGSAAIQFPVPGSSVTNTTGGLTFSPVGISTPTVPFGKGDYIGIYVDVVGASSSIDVAIEGTLYLNI